MLTAVVSLTILGGLFGLGLGWAARRFRVESDPVVDRIDAILPQTQCGQCNYPGCRPYAEAIAAGEAPINQCPPGGEDGIRALADLFQHMPVTCVLPRSKGTRSGSWRWRAASRRSREFM